MISDEEFEAKVAEIWAQIDSEREAMVGDRWSEHFGRSRLGRNVFFCRVAWLHKILLGEGYPDDYASMMMGPAHLSVAFADGGWFARWQSWSFGIGGLHGQWIVGFAALRHICDLLGLVPPRRLRGEQGIPDPDLLRIEVERQMRLERPALEERARLLLTAETQYSYLPDAVFGLMGAPRPRLGLDETDTALMLDAGSWEFLERVGGAA